MLFIDVNQNEANRWLPVVVVVAADVAVVGQGKPQHGRLIASVLLNC